jgi:drug/metabolite transporter (DMT)-like permease
MALWSTGAVFLRESGMPPATFMALANVVGAAALLLPRPAEALGAAARAPRGLLVALALAGSLNAGTYFWGLSVAPIADVLAAHYVAPVLVALAAPALLGERPEAAAWAALALSLAGLWAILAGAGADGGPAGSRLGVGLGLVSAVGFAGALILIRALAARGTAPRAISLVLAAGLLPFVIPLVDPAAVTPRGAALAAAAGILHLPLAAVLFTTGAARVPAHVAGILGYSELAFGAFWGRAIYAEPITAGRLLGALLVFAGGALALRRPSP